MDAERTARRFFFALLVATTVLLAFVVQAIASALLLAAALAGVLAPLHTRLAARLRGRRRIAAAALVTALMTVSMGPLVTLAGFLTKESREAMRFVAVAVHGERVTALLDKLPSSLEKLAAEGLAGLADVDHAVSAHLDGTHAASTLLAALTATGSAEGEELVTWLDNLSPLRAGETRELLTQFRKVSFSVIVSTLISAGVQALTALLGYSIAGVPHPAFFTAITFPAAFIPAIGAGVLCLFVAALMYATGHGPTALFLAVWGLAVVSLVDHVVKPLLIKAGMELRGVVVFFALIGGLRAFGAIGLLIGPLVVALSLALLCMYQRDYAPRAAVAEASVRREAA